MTLPPALVGVPDARVRVVASLPESLEGATAVGRFWEAKPGALLLRVPGVATYLAQDGAVIDVWIKQDADPSAVDLYLHGTARAALLHQRGDLPLHASCLWNPESQKTVAICGHSGNGKSTLTCELLARGWKLVADDTSRISVLEGKAIVWPTLPLIKLWKDACDKLGIDTTSLRPVRNGMNKFLVKVDTVEAPLSLDAVLELRTEDGPLERISSLPQRMSVMSRHAFRPGQIAALGVQKQHLQMALTVASQCAVGSLFGARLLPVERLADRVEEAMSWTATSF